MINTILAYVSLVPFAIIAVWELIIIIKISWKAGKELFTNY